MCCCLEAPQEARPPANDKHTTATVTTATTTILTMAKLFAHTDLVCMYALSNAYLVCISLQTPDSPITQLVDCGLEIYARHIKPKSLMHFSWIAAATATTVTATATTTITATTDPDRVLCQQLPGARSLRFCVCVATMATRRL